MEISPSIPAGLSKGIHETEVREAANEPLKNANLIFADNNFNESNRETLNEGFFSSMVYINKRKNLENTDIIKIKNYTQQFTPENEDDPFTLNYELKDNDVANINSLQFEVYKKNDEDEKTVLYESSEITDLTETTFEWDGKINTGEGDEKNQKGGYAEYEDNPLVTKLIANEKGTNKAFSIEKAFKVKATGVEITAIDELLVPGKNRLNIEYSFPDISPENAKIQIYKDKGDEDELIYTDKEIEVKQDQKIVYKKEKEIGWSGKINNKDHEKYGEYASTGEYYVKLNSRDTTNKDATYETTKTFYLQENLIASFTVESPEFYENFEFKKEEEETEIGFMYEDLPVFGATGTEVCYEGGSSCSEDKLNITYNIDKTEKGSIKGKLEVFKNGEAKKSTSNPSFTKKDIKIGKEQLFKWDGQLSGGDEYIKHSESPFTIRLITTITTKEGDKYKISESRQAYVDEIKEDWENYRFADDWNFSYYRFHRKKWGKSIEDANIYDDALTYLDKNIIESGNRFLGQNIGPINVRFLYVLKLVENQMKSDGVYSKFKEAMHLWFAGLRSKGAFKKSVSNHSLGFALDIDARKNPMIKSRAIYKFIYAVTGIDLYGERFIGKLHKMKKAHQLFMKRLNVPNNEPKEWEPNSNRIQNAQKILAELPDKIDFIGKNRKKDDIFPLNKLTKNNIGEELENILNRYENLQENYNSEKYTSLKDNYKAFKEKYNKTKKLFNYYSKAVFIKNNHEEAYQKAKSYFYKIDGIIKNYDGFINKNPEDYNFGEKLLYEINKYLADFPEDANATRNFSSEVKKLDSHIGSYEKMARTLKTLDNSTSPYGDAIFWWSFWTLSQEFTEYMINFEFDLRKFDSGKSGKGKLIYWGGFYSENHDWMHFEVRPNSLKKAWHSQNLLHSSELTLKKLVKRINAISDDKYKVKKEKDDTGNTIKKYIINE